MTKTHKKRPQAAQPLYEGAEWDFQTIDKTFRALEDIALNELKLT